MERVHYQQEQMLPELKDLVEKNLFTENEIRHIVKQRTAFESALVRRVAKKADFLRYVSYEMDLETLRRKRVKRMDLPKAPATVSDYAFVRRQFHIFERALKRFKSDVSLWVQYIQVAKREGAKALVGRITARALLLHPNNTTFYILAAAHELDNLSPSAARALLQRGIRVNPDSVDMWKEYLKMELGFIESLRRRWDILGIKVDADAAGKGKKKITDDDPSPKDVPEEGGSAEIPAMDMEVDEEEGDGTEARQQIMEGAIVQSVIASAAKALPVIELFDALKTVISEHPSPPALQSTLLGTLYDVLGQTLPRDPKGMEMRAYRHLKGQSPSAVDFVEGLSAANEEMLSVIGEGNEEPLLEVYASFVERWYDKTEDDHLKAYLISSLQELIQKHTRSPSLLAGHIKLLLQTRSTAPAKIRKTAEKYSSKAPRSSRVWLARLEVENETEGGAVEDVWAEARKKVDGTAEEVQRVWTWGIEHLKDATPEAKKRVHEELLRESLSLPSVHEVLLINYVTLLPETGGSSDQKKHWVDSVRHMARSYLTTARVWRTVFALVARTEWKGATGSDGKAQVLGDVYEIWRQKDAVGATLELAQWLLAHGHGRAATEVVARAHAGGLSEAESAGLGQQWQAVL